MTKDGLVVMMHAKLRKAGGPAQFADSLEIGSEYLRQLLAGDREPGPRVLRKLGVEKVVTYRVIGAKA